ncbi:MAG: aminopeptidase P N-terminal domain-containing protein [Myxococcota bacterium]
MAPDFAQHRRMLLEQLPKDEAVLLFGSPHHLRNGDAEYRYRPASDLFWLTGWPDPDVALLVRHGDTPFTLFVQPKNRELEVWTGYRPGPAGAVNDYGVDAAHDIGELPDQLVDALQGVSALHFAFAEDAENDAMLAAVLKKTARKSRKTKSPTPLTLHHPQRLLHELRLRKTEGEIDAMREAARITSLAHKAAMSTAAPGVGEWEIDALLNYTYRREGGTGAGYTNIVAGGNNACILHYIVNDQPLNDGDLLLIDSGGESGFYTADVTRTFPVNGRFTEPQRRVYTIVLRAQLAAIDAARAGRKYSEMHTIATRVLTEGMVELGLLEGDIDEIIEADAHRAYYMHGTGHWLGLDVHDVGNYHRDGDSRLLEPGMIVTVEPGLYIPEDDEDAPEELRGIGIRIEDDILFTDGDPDVLTADIPNTIEEVEAACANVASVA